MYFSTNTLVENCVRDNSIDDLYRYLMILAGHPPTIA